MALSGKEKLYISSGGGRATMTLEQIATFVGSYAGLSVTASQISDASTQGKSLITSSTPIPIAAGGTGNMTGLAATATKLATARTITLTVAGVAAAPSFDGSANVAGTIVLPTPTSTIRGGTLLGVAVANTTDSTTAPTTLNALLA